MTSDWLASWQKALQEHRPGTIRSVDLQHFYSRGEFLEFMHILLEHKQMLYFQLSGVDLSTESGRFTAAKLQGQILALDFLPELMQVETEENINGDSTRS